MINIKISMLCISFFVLLLSGCVMDTEMPDSKKEEGSPVTLSIDTRALGTGESQINTIRIIQVQRNVSTVIKNNRFVANPGSPLVVAGVSGEYDIYVIANETDNGNELAALRHVATLDDLKQVILPYDVTQRTSSNIPMFGKIENVTIGLPATLTGNATIKVGGVDNGTILPATVTRLATRIDLTVKSKSFSDLASVSFTGLPDGISLFGNNYESTEDKKQTVSVQANAFTDVIPATTGYITEKTKTSIILPSSLFEPKAEVSKAAKIEVYIQGKPAAFKAAIGHVAQPDAVDKDYTLHPNSQYSLTALVAGDDLTIESQVKNWDTSESNYPAGGGSFWKGQPQDVRVGLNGTNVDATATFTAILAPNGTNVSFKWYCIKQNANTDFTLVTEEKSTGIGGNDNTSTLTVKASGLDDACMVYCVATITAPDGRIDRLESNYATFMPVGDWTQPAGTYPVMQNWKAPLNAPLGSTCLLQDNRDNKVYRVKLMADGNWWMVQDLAYGQISSNADFVANCTNQEITNLIGAGLYGVSVSSNLPTGGHLYNAYAALQFRGVDSDAGGPDLHKVYLPSLCPEGWHLPGNANGAYNEEWQIFIDKTKIDLYSNTDLARFGYNDMTAFNAYNMEPDFSQVISFHGGYRAGQNDRFSPIDFLTLGIAVGPYGGVFKQISERNNNKVKIPIRCLRNFK